MVRFTAKDVSEIARVPIGTLNYWISKDSIPDLKAEPTVAGKSRLFHLADVQRIALYRFLSVNLGIDPKKIAEFWPHGPNGAPNTDFVELVTNTLRNGGADWYFVRVQGINQYDASIFFTQCADQAIECEEKKYPVGSVTKVNVSAIIRHVLEIVDSAYT